MTLVNSDVYIALRQAGVNEETAGRAAAALVGVAALLILVANVSTQPAAAPLASRRPICAFWPAGCLPAIPRSARS